MFHMLDNLLFMAKYRLNAFLRDEEGDVNIVSIVVLIGIAVLLAVFCLFLTSFAAREGGRFCGGGGRRSSK